MTIYRVDMYPYPESREPYATVYVYTQPTLGQCRKIFAADIEADGGVWEPSFLTTPVSVKRLTELITL